MDNSVQQGVPHLEGEKNKSKYLLVAVVLLLMLVSGIVGYFIGVKVEERNTHIAVSRQVASSPSISIPTMQSTGASKGKTYANGKISFNYPNDYKVGGSSGYIYIGPNGYPNGSCVSGEIGIDSNGGIYGNSYEGDVENIKKANVKNLQITTIPNGWLFVFTTNQGSCGGILAHVALLQHASTSIEITLDGNDKKLLDAFNQIIATFHFSS